MKKFLLFCTLLTVFPTAYSATEKACSEVLEELSSTESLTNSLWGYIKLNVSDKQLVTFNENLKIGKLINPGIVKLTKLGPIFSNSRDMVIYKTIESYMGKVDQLDMLKLKKFVSEEVKARKLMVEEKSVVQNKTNISFKLEVLRNRFIEEFGDLLTRRFSRGGTVESEFLHDLISVYPESFLSNAISSIDQRRNGLTETIFLYLDVLDMYLDQTITDDSGLYSVVQDYLDRRGSIKDPLSLFKKLFIDRSVSHKVEGIFKAFERAYPDKKMSDQFRELYQLKLLQDHQSDDYNKLYYRSENSTWPLGVGGYAFESFVRMSGAEGVEIVRKAAQVGVSTPKSLIMALAINGSDEAAEHLSYILEHEGFYDVDMNEFFLLFLNQRNLSSSFINFFKKLQMPNKIGKDKSHHNLWQSRAEELLAKQDSQEGFELIKRNFTSGTPPLHLLIGRQESEIFEMVKPYLVPWKPFDHQAQNLYENAVKTMAKIKDPKTRDFLLKSLIRDDQMHLIAYLNGHDAKFLQPVLDYYNDKELTRPFFSMIKGLSDPSLLSFIHRGIKQGSKVAEDAKECFGYFFQEFYGKKIDPESLKIFRETLTKSMTSEVDKESFRIAYMGYVYALMVAKVEALQTSEEYKFISEVTKVFNDH